MTHMQRRHPMAREAQCISCAREEGCLHDAPVEALAHRAELSM